jgi:hypothetical protein
MRAFGRRRRVKLIGAMGAMGAAQKEKNRDISETGKWTKTEKTITQKEIKTEKKQYKKQYYWAIDDN